MVDLCALHWIPIALTVIPLDSIRIAYRVYPSSREALRPLAQRRLGSGRRSAALGDTGHNVRVRATGRKSARVDTFLRRQGLGQR